MKNFTFLLLVSILFQSCFSYKKVDYNEITSVKKQKIQLLKLGSYSFIEGRLVSKNENTMILENNQGNQTILKDEIYEVKVRKFSILKTVKGAASSYIYIGIGALALLSLSGFP